MKHFAAMTAVCGVILAISVSQANAELISGLLDDFEDGTLGGWSPRAGNTANVAGGPSGSTRYLEISPASKLAAFDAGINGGIDAAVDAGINGGIDAAVDAIEVDMFRPLGSSTLDIRLVLFGPGVNNRWTSTNAQALLGDGVWQTYRFGILPGDLTQVLGTGTYLALTGNLNRIMFRHDTAGPTAGGTPVAPNIGAFGIDNVSAVPEPHPGDANLDGTTDLSDFNIWNANKFIEDTDWSRGDFNGDDVTDLSDFNIWNAHKFTVASGGAAPAPVEVPEPGMVVLLGVGVMGLVMRWRWRRRRTG